MKRTSYLFTFFAVLVACASIASATIIGDLKTGSGGTVTVTLTNVTFNPDPGSNPPGPPWNAEVASGTNIRFAGCPTGTLGTAGCLDFAPFAPDEAIQVANLTSSTVLPVANFMTFAGNGLTHVSLSYSLVALGPGSSNTNCQTLGIGDSCSVFAGAPLVLTRTASGTQANLSIAGFANDGTGAVPYMGQFQSPISGMTPGQIQLFFCPSGTCTAADFASGRSETSSQSGDFIASTVPEPQTTALVLGGLLVLLGRVGMRRFNRSR
jgi:hypothetical protein